MKKTPVFDFEIMGLISSWPVNVAIYNNLQQEPSDDVSMKTLGIPSGRKSINEIFGFSDKKSEK